MFNLILFLLNIFLIISTSCDTIYGMNDQNYFFIELYSYLGIVVPKQR